MQNKQDQIENKNKNNHKTKTKTKKTQQNFYTKNKQNKKNQA